MDMLLGEFREYLINSKKSSANTVESYIRDVTQFTSYCRMNGITDLSTVDSDVVEKFLEYLEFNGKSEATRSRIIASLRCFYRMLISEKVVLKDPLAEIKLKHFEKKLPGILEAKEIVNLLSQPDEGDYKGCRDKAMLEMLYATGIKVSEIIELKVSDVNLQIGVVYLKNERSERIVPMYPAAQKAVADYIERVRPVLLYDDTSDILFTNMNGRAMSRQGCWKIIKHYAQKAGIDKDITPHTLRHSFAAHLLENGAPLKDIKEMLGHTDISSTQVYAQLIRNKYTVAYTRFHPLAK